MTNATPTSETPAEVAAEPANAKPVIGGTRKAKALTASLYELAGFGTGQAIRLAGNLVLTRILYPEAFGLAALVTIFNQGLNMLSDLGVEPCVVRSTNGDSEELLNTAWTISLVRGAGLYAVALALAWPVGFFYDQPQLGPLIAVGSTSIVITAAASTSLMTLRRRVDSKRTNVIEVTSQALALLTMIGVAWVTKSVWALVIGNVVNAATRSLISHFLVNVGYRNRFRWSKEAAEELVSFGRWIFFASALHFAASQVDRLFIGRSLGVAELGIYTVAATLSELGVNIATRLTHKILYPTLSQVYAQDADRIKGAYYRARRALDYSFLPASGALFTLAPVVIGVLYDDRYLDAGWILRILALRTMLALVVTTSETCLFSIGQSKFGFLKSLLRLVWMAIGLPVGFHLWGIAGIVWVTALADLPGTFVLYPALRSRRILDLRFEALVPVLFAAGAIVAVPLLWLIG